MDMTGTRIIALAITMLTLGTNAFGDDTSPNEILKKVAATYKALKTYKAEGTITSDFDTGDGMKMKTETSFSILLKKPNLYLISWTQKNMPMPGMVQSGAVWSDGTQPYLYMGTMNAYSKMTSDEIALGGAIGISGGAALTIPSLFLSVFKQSALFSRLKDPKIEKTEKVGGEDCYVLSGPSAASKKETFWISKTSFLIRKYNRSLESPEGGVVTPEMTDEQIEEAIKSMGLEVTEERKKNVKEMMEKSITTFKTVKMKGSTTELHANVSSPKLNKSDFKFAIPEGTVLKDSLFGGMFSGNKGTSNKSSTAFAMDARRLAISGSELTEEEAESLEKRIEQNPRDVSSRTKLLGYYFDKLQDRSAREAKRKHVLWLILNSPESEVLATSFGQLYAILDAKAYSQGKKAWIDQLKRKPANLKLLEHSANFFQVHDRELAKESLQKARSLDMDNPKWPAALGQLYSLGMITNSLKAKTDAAGKALEQFEIAYKLSTGVARNDLLQSLAKVALAANRPKKAKEYAEKMLNKNGSGWNYGDNIHHGNIILGRIALTLDDVEEAKERLIKAGKTPGSLILNLLGPDMTLAKELLQKGEKDVVLKYIKLCSKFWKMGKDRLDKWSVDVKDGKIPDFDSNLN